MWRWLTGRRHAVLAPVFFGILIMVALWIVSIFNYLLFHSLAEVFSIIVACGIFMFARSGRRFFDNGYLRLLGIAYLFIGFIDLLHMLSYKGMDVFAESGGNISIQLWIAGRYLESFSFLAASFALRRKPKDGLVFAAYLAFTVTVILTIFFIPVFPKCYDDARGLTEFKVNSEYIICGILLVSLWQLFRDRSDFSNSVMLLLAASIITTIAAEVAFTLYVGVYDFFNLVGHMLKIVSFYLIHKAIIEIGLARPYDILFRQLRQKQDALEAANRQMTDELEHARRTQLALLPNDVPSYPSCRFAAKYVPMSEVGGDLYDFFSLPGGRIGVMMADVVGHGVGAALIASMVSTLFKTYASQHESISDIFRAMNESLVEKLPPEDYVTAFMCAYEPDSQTLRYSSAGHLEAYIVRPSMNMVIALRNHGIALGLISGLAEEWKESTVQLEVGDKILLYTDGLTETRNPRGEMYDQDRLRAHLSKLAGLDVDEMLDATYKEIVDYARGETFEDDIALVGLEITDGN